MQWNKFIITVLTALAIFAQGLYFNEQWLVALMLIIVVYLALIVKAGHIRWPRTFLCKWLIIYVALHLVGYLFFQEKGMLVFGLLKSCLYLLFYFVLIQLQARGYSQMMQQAYVIIMVVAGYFTTLIFVTGWFEDLHYVIDGRVAGPVQYANTFGILLLVAFMFLSATTSKPWMQWVGVIGLVVALIMTMSRGNYLIALVMMFLIILTKKPNQATLWSLASSIIIGVILLMVFDNRETAQRLTEATGSSEWHSRLLYYSDALKMIFNQPMGYGTNGYHYAQSFYQTGSTYHVKFVHSGWLQHFLDLGLIGGLMMSALMFHSVFLGGHQWMNRLVLLALLGHSLIDMNLQFPIVWLLVILLLSDEDQPTAILKGVPVIAVWASVFCLLMMTGYMMIPTTYFANGHYDQAISYYPYYTEAYRKYLNNQATGELVVPYAKTLEGLNPYVTESYPVLRDEAIKNGDYDQALLYSKKMLTYSPLLIEHHEQYSHALLLAATYWHAYEEDDKAVEALQAMLLIPGSLDKLAKEKNTDYNVKHKPDLQMNDALMKDYIEASYLMNEINEGL